MDEERNLRVTTVPSSPACSSTSSSSSSSSSSSGCLGAVESSKAKRLSLSHGCGAPPHIDSVASRALMGSSRSRAVSTPSSTLANSNNSAEWIDPHYTDVEAPLSDYAEMSVSSSDITCMKLKPPPLPRWDEFHKNATADDLETFKLQLSDLLRNSAGDSKKLLNSKDFDGRTMLHKAAFSNRVEAVKLLLEANADPLLLDFVGSTSLHYAILGGHTEVLRLLLESSERVKNYAATGVLPDEIVYIQAPNARSRERIDFIRTRLTTVMPPSPALLLSPDNLSAYYESTDPISISSNVGVNQGKWYFEVTLLTDCSSVRIGWLYKLKYITYPPPPADRILGNDVWSYVYDGGHGHKINKGSKKDYGSTYHRRWIQGDVIGCYADLETQGGILQFTINGHPLGIAYLHLYKPKEERELLFPGISLQNRSWLRVNFGDSPFEHEPCIDSGYSPYCEAPLFNKNALYPPSVLPFIPIPYFGHENLLNFASAVGNVNCIVELLDKYCSFPPNGMANPMGMNPIHLAVLHGNVAALEVLIKKGGKLLINIGNSCGMYPIHQAISGGHIECFCKLMENEAIPYVLDADEHSVLHYILKLKRNYKKFYEWIPQLLEVYAIPIGMREWNSILPLYIVTKEESINKIFRFKVCTMLEKERARIKKSQKLLKSDEDEESMWQYLKDKSTMIHQYFARHINFNIPIIRILNPKTDLLINLLLKGDENEDVVRSFQRGKWKPKLQLIVRMANCELLQMRSNTGGRALTSSEERRNISRVFIWDFFQELNCLADAIHIEFSLRHIDLSHTEASLRSITSLPSASQIETLDLSFTLISWRSLSNLGHVPNLKKLFLNHCPSLSKGDQTFDQLKNSPHKCLEVISLIETSTSLSLEWLNSLEAGCPSMSVIYFTSKRGTKVVGLDDTVLMQSMIDPHLLPCGHIADKQTLDQMMKKECFMCRAPFHKSEILRFIPHITKLERIVTKLASNQTQMNSPAKLKRHWTQNDLTATQSPKWRATIVDAWPSCRPLEDRVLLHVENGCGEFFNLSTFQKYYLPTRARSFSMSETQLYSADETESHPTSPTCYSIAPSSPEALIVAAAQENWICTGCMKPLKDLRVCYPNTAPPDSHYFENLEYLAIYSENP